MKILDNINNTLGLDIQSQLTKKSKLKIAASYFSIYAYAALKKELEKIEELQFVLHRLLLQLKTLLISLRKRSVNFSYLN